MERLEWFAWKFFDLCRERRCTTERFDWKTVADRRDVVHRAVQSLASGGLVAFPSDTVYCLASVARAGSHLARIQAAAKRLERIAKVDSLPPLTTLSLARPTDIARFVPTISAIGKRLVERCLPGPLVLICERGAANGELDDFAVEVCQLVESPAGLAMHVADHAALLQSLRLLGAPAVALPIPNAHDADAALEAVGAVDGLIDDGATRYGKPPTVVQLRGNALTVAFEGILSTNRIHRLAGEIVTFVCTGNTCRSPMAEGIFKRIVADALGCDPTELSDHGYTILSAGVAAGVGGPPAEEAVAIAREYGIGIEDHATSPLTSDLVRLSDRIVAMTSDHRNAVARMWPDAAAKTSTLAGPVDIADPVGYPIERYRQCAAEMAAHLRSLWKSMSNS